MGPVEGLMGKRGFTLLCALFVMGCSGSETALTKDEEKSFGGTKPPKEVLDKLNSTQGVPAGVPNSATKSSTGN